jgi:hypothetical protein
VIDGFGTLGTAVGVGAGRRREGGQVRKVSLLLGGMVVVAMVGMTGVASARPAAPGSSVICQYRVTSSSLNFRNAPGIHATLRYTLPRNATFWAHQETTTNAFDPYTWRLAEDRNYAANEFMRRTATPCTRL